MRAFELDGDERTLCVDPEANDGVPSGFVVVPREDHPVGVTIHGLRESAFDLGHSSIHYERHSAGRCFGFSGGGW